jgi:hypothetical protein
MRIALLSSVALVGILVMGLSSSLRGATPPANGQERSAVSVARIPQIVLNKMSRPVQATTQHPQTSEGKGVNSPPDAKRPPGKNAVRSDSGSDKDGAVTALPRIKSIHVVDSEGNVKEIAVDKQ